MKIFWSILYSIPVFIAAWFKTGDLSLFPLGFATMVFIYAYTQVQENLETYRRTSQYEIPRQSGFELWWIIFVAPNREALFDALNVSHHTRKYFTLEDRMMQLPPEDRRRIMNAFSKDEDE